MPRVSDVNIYDSSLEKTHFEVRQSSACPRRTVIDQKIAATASLSEIPQRITRSNHHAVLMNLSNVVTSASLFALFALFALPTIAFAKSFEKQSASTTTDYSHVKLVGKSTAQGTTTKYYVRGKPVGKAIRR